MVNHTAFWLSEYNCRQNLKALGFTESLSDLDGLTAEIFLEITAIYAAIDREKSEKNSRGRR